MKVPSTIEPEAEGVTRSYYVVRFHEEQPENLPCTYDKKNNTIKFTSSKFSTYMLCYVDDKVTSTPNTPAPSATASSKPSGNGTIIIGGGTNTNYAGGGSGSGGGSGIVSPTATPIPTPVTGTPVPSKPTSVPTNTQAPNTSAPVPTKAPTPTQTPTSTSKPSGITKVTVKNANYKIVSSDNTKIATFTGVKKSVKEVVIPASIKVGNKTYKVTSIAKNALKGDKKVIKVTIGTNVKKIGKNAFNGCSKLKKIIIKTKKLNMKNVGKNTFKEISKNAVFKVPKGKVKLYKKIVKARGANKKVQVKK